MMRLDSLPVVRRVDALLGSIVATACVALLSVEMVLMLVGVVARYVFDRPLIWGDELTSLLFEWLTVLGAVLALRSAGNMRMTAVVDRCTGTLRRVFEAFATVATVIFLASLLLPAIDYAGDDAMISLTTMDVSMGWRSAAIPVGIALMLVSSLLRSPLRPGWPEVAAGVVAIAVVACLEVAAPALPALGNLNLVLFFLVGAAAAVFVGIPIAFAFGLATLGYLEFSTTIPVSILAARMDAGMSPPLLLSVPLFIFLGLLIEMTGMAQVIVGFLASLLGHVRGGLSYVLVAAMFLVSGISGSKAADMAAVAPALFPEMIKHGARRGDLVSLLAATGAQTETIPPSLILITIGSVTGISIATLFAGGIVPGIAGGLLLCATVWWRSRKSEAPVSSRVPARKVVRSFVIALPALALPFVIRSAIVEGVATATEVSAIGIAYSLVAGIVVYRQFDWRRLWPMLVRAATLSGAILLIVGAATAMAWAITQSGVARSLGPWLAGVPGGAVSFLAVSAVIFIVLGSILEGIPAIVLMGPLLFPIARQLGINEVHYAIVAVLAMGIGLFSPPLGVGYYVACAIGGCDPGEGLPYIGPYVLALIAGLVLVAAVPWLTTAVL